MIKKVLILEDMPIFVEVIDKILKELSIWSQITHASYLQEAIELLKIKTYDCIILQGKAAGGYGTEALKYIAEEDQKKKVIIISVTPYFKEVATEKGIYYWNRTDNKVVKEYLKKILS